MLVIDDSTKLESICNGFRGLAPRDTNKFPAGVYSSTKPYDAVEFPLVKESDYEVLIKEGVKEKSFLNHIRDIGDDGKQIPSLVQGGYGYCWSHSTVHAVTLIRARDNQPYIPLSAFAVAATIKNGRNEGGWSALSLDFIAAKGIPSQKFWPQGNANVRNGTKECWDDAAKNRVTESWVDMAAPVYKRKLTFQQVMTLLLNRIPVACDFMWWGHAVCAVAPVIVEKGSYGLMIWNSWGDDWGDKGMAILRGERAIPDNAVAPRVVMANNG